LLPSRPGDWEIVVCEDSSPKGKEIAGVVRRFAQAHKLLNVRFLTTPANLGYDGNLRCLIDHAEGRYCVFMGDDDLWCAGALQQLTKATDADPRTSGVISARVANQFQKTPEKWWACIAISPVTAHSSRGRQQWRHFSEGRSLFPASQSARTRRAQ
jgi:glycosyltransferase involved in cell wall biosynthesis